MQLYLILLTDNLYEISMKDLHQFGKSLLQLNFNFISPSNCLHLDLKITSLGFFNIK